MKNVTQDGQGKRQRWTRTMEKTEIQQNLSPKEISQNQDNKKLPDWQQAQSNNGKNTRHLE